MNLGQIKSECYRRLGFEPSPGTTVETRIEGFINSTHREILRDKQFARFRRQLILCLSVANQPLMAIPRSVVRIFNIQDRNNNLVLTEKDMLWIRSQDPGLRSVTANPWVYAKYNLASPITRQPTTPSIIWVASTIAGDLAQEVTIEGFRQNGGYYTANRAINGVVGGAIGSATDILNISKFFISSGTPAGEISIYQAAIGISNTLATIPIGGTLSRYTLVHLYPTPSAATQYLMDAEVHIGDMTEDNDEPLCPEDFDELIFIGVKRREYELREKMDKQFAAAKQEWREVRAQMVTFVNSISGLQNQTGYNGRYSQLGPWFPSGT